MVILLPTSEFEQLKMTFLLLYYKIHVRFKELYSAYVSNFVRSDVGKLLK